MKIELDTNGLFNKIIGIIAVAALTFSGNLVLDFYSVKAKVAKNTEANTVLIRLICEHVIGNNDSVCHKFSKKETR